MAFVVEDGTGLADANSYAAESAFDAYLDSTGKTATAGADAQTALVRATAWVDAHFGGRFPGTRLNGRSQALLWPRTGAVDREGADIADDAVPDEVKRATFEAALREMASAGSLAPDIVPVTAAGGAIKRERKRIGPMEKEIEYTEGGASGSSRPVFPEIDAILAPILTYSGAGMVPLLRA